MNNEHHLAEELRLFDLLADRATDGLTAAEEAELESLLSKFPDVDPQGFDYATAVLDAPADVTLPARMIGKLQADADRYFAPITPAAGKKRRLPWVAISGWTIAAGLLMALAWPSKKPETPSVAEKRDRLVADSTSGAVPFKSAEPVSGLSGEVVWSGNKQEGYLRVVGLKPNDPKERQYQLWIVDGDRKNQPPVDGGVFNVGPDGTALVPIRTPIPVFKAVLFAVTEEESGGVVVSEDGKKGKFVVAMAPVAK